MTTAYEKPITRANVAAAIASFGRDRDRLETHGSLLGYLLSHHRVDEAALVLDEPRQVVAKTLDQALQALQRSPASFPLFEAIVAKRPPLYRVAEEAEAPARLFFERFRGDQEDLCLRAVRQIAEAYGHEGALQGEDTLLHAVAASGLHAPIAYLVGRGARLDIKNTFDNTPFEALFAGRCAWLKAETIPLLRSGPTPDDALGAFLASAPAERPLGEIRAVVETLLGCGASVEGLHGDRTPLAHALLLERPLADRKALAEQLAAAGATYARALPGVVTTHRPGLLRDALAISQAEPGATYGKAKQTLLHIAAEHLDGEDYVDEDERADERTIPVLTALIELGESVTAKDAKGKTPLELARKKRSEFPAKDWKRIEALLTPGGSGKKGARTGGAAALAGDEKVALRTLVPDAAFALGVLGALLRAKRTSPSALTKIARAACEEADGDEAAREAVAVDLLHGTEVSADDLAAVTKLSFDVDERIYELLSEVLDVDLGGESEALRARSIDGVAHLSRLEELALDVYAGDVDDLAPLAGHPSLRELRLERRCRSAEVLLTLPELKRVVASDPAKDLGTAAAKLEAKGVVLVTRKAHLAVSSRIPAKKAPAKKAPAKKAPAKKAPAKKAAATRR